MLLLEHLGETAAAQRLQVIEQITADISLHTRDLGGKATMDQFTQAVCQGLPVKKEVQRRAA